MFTIQSIIATVMHIAIGYWWVIVPTVLICSFFADKLSVVRSVVLSVVTCVVAALVIDNMIALHFQDWKVPAETILDQILGIAILCGIVAIWVAPFYVACLITKHKCLT